MIDKLKEVIEGKKGMNKRLCGVVGCMRVHAGQEKELERPGAGRHEARHLQRDEGKAELPERHALS